MVRTLDAWMRLGGDLKADGCSFNGEAGLIQLAITLVILHYALSLEELSWLTVSPTICLFIRFIESRWPLCIFLSLPFPAGTSGGCVLR